MKKGLLNKFEGTSVLGDVRKGVKSHSPGVARNCNDFFKEPPDLMNDVKETTTLG